MSKSTHETDFMPQRRPCSGGARTDTDAPRAFVYIADIPQNAPIGEVDCVERMAEISATANEAARREKYFVWKLLCYALDHSLGLRGNELEFAKKSYGGWAVGDIELSLSHSDGAVAVAISRVAVGVDIERVHSPRSNRLAERIMNAAELEDYARTPDERRRERLIEIWTAKEALFKSKHLAAFIPSQHDTLCESVVTRSVTLGDASYICSVAAAQGVPDCVFTTVPTDVLAR